jgi:two-component system, NarL family, invasion response regulator UvrY
MKILICDDHKIVRDGLRKILEQLPEVVLIEEAGDGDELLNKLDLDNFNILVLDIALPGKSGLELLETVKTNWPSINVLILSMHSQEQYAIRAFKHGASAYLTKEVASEELLIALKTVWLGKRYITPSIADKLADQLNTGTKEQVKHEELTVREFEIMLRLAKGKSLLETGKELFISGKTVSTYRWRIMRKMGLKTNADLTKYCIENKLI